MDYSIKTYIWDRMGETTWGRYLGRREREFIECYLGAAAFPHLILDVPCGSGRWSIPLQARGFEVIGLDYSGLPLALLQEKSGAIPISRGSADSLPFGAGSFDSVLTIQGFEYFDRYELFLSECNRVLIDGGLLLFDFLNRHSYKWLLKQVVGRGLESAAANLSYQEVSDALAHAGFEIEASRGYGWPPFHRESNSALVRPAIAIENVLRLDRCPTVSPRVIVAARKRQCTVFRMTSR
jgi:SAM-dependent methyltransferase